jgi:tetratricopeptide (TPR) repeat protein
MIIWIRNRKGWIAGVFSLIAGIFALSFVIGGVGTGNNASLSDIFNNNSGSGGSTTPQASSIGKLQKTVKARPNDAQAWQQLADAYASATRPADEAGAWQHYVTLKPANLDGLQRLALAQAQVATGFGQQAQSYQQQASSSSPGNDSTFSGGTLGSLSQDPVSQAQAASETDQQTKALIKAGVLAKRANNWWKKSASTYGKIVVLPAFAKNDLAATVWLNYGSAAQSANDPESAIKAYDAFLKIAPDDVNAPQVRTIVKKLKTTIAPATTTTTTTTP